MLPTKRSGIPIQSNVPLHAKAHQERYRSFYGESLTSAAITRYILRGGVLSLRAVEPDFLKKRFNVKHVENLYDRLVSQLSKQAPENDLRYELSGMGVKDGDSGRHRHLIDLVEKGDKGSFIKAAGSDIRGMQYTRLYDTSLGIGSLSLTASHSWNVYQNIKNIFAETVSYENGKDPSHIGWSDLNHSDNRLVSQTLSNFLKLNLTRALADLTFFGREFGRLGKIWKPFSYSKAMEWGEIGIGVKGFFFFRDLMTREPSFYEELIRFSDKKLSPLRGVGDKISEGDVFDLYQRYNKDHNPHNMFSDITIQENTDAMDWEKSRVIFQRIADLMNQTYKYKPSSLDTQYHEDRKIQEPNPADFALPKFLYLLGHDMIDMHKPEQTLAYVEIASKYDMEAVKSVKRAIENGASLEQARTNFPLEKDYLSNIDASVMTQEPTSASQMPDLGVAFFPASERHLAGSNENRHHTHQTKAPGTEVNDARTHNVIHPQKDLGREGS